ncbi:uncharacterized protein LOC144048630 isoform X2 [Vanacampus margaritifer]
MRSDGERAAGSRHRPTSPADAAGVSPPEQQEAAATAHASRQSQSAPSLEVTIQRRDHARHFNMAGTQAAGAGLRCHMCATTCHSMQMFVAHMSGSAHVSKWKAMTRSVGVIAHTLTNRRRRWCDACQSHFSDDVISHRRTKRHKERKRASRPFCAACRRHVRSPRKFVEHMKSDQHKRQALVKKAQEEEELITVDAVGCFEDEPQPQVAPEATPTRSTGDATTRPDGRGSGAHPLIPPPPPHGSASWAARSRPSSASTQRTSKTDSGIRGATCYREQLQKNWR